MCPEFDQVTETANGSAARTELPEPFHTWNQTRTAYPRNSTVACVFEETVALHPSAIALAFAEEQITYRELNRRANRLAHVLRRMGVGEEALVGCCLERSVELIVAFLAILKAGGAYVPLDPSYPKEPFDWMLQNIKPALILTQGSVGAALLEDSKFQTLRIDHVDYDGASAEDANPAPIGGPKSLAYVMYTSGSTGRPKGVMVENRGIVRLVRDTDFCHFGEDQVFLQFAPVSFDASTFEIWGPLLNGGRLVVMPAQASSVSDVGKAIHKYGVTTLWLTSALLNVMVDENLEGLRPLRQLVAGGDVLSPRHVRKVLENLPDCTVINGYGPTENTTFTCCHAMRCGDRIGDSVPIGRPISNTRAHILDEQMRSVAVGEFGELYAAGDGVARGYLNAPAETAEKFLPDPFSDDSEGRMYRTGDLARWRADGLIEFLGRRDNQVKVLGHRIELGEIETTLRMHEGVRQVAVIAHADDNLTKRLVAYYVSAPNSAPSPRDLQEFLHTKLAPYMVPALFVPLESMPLSANGKVDRAALPNPTFESRASANQESEPASDLEQKLTHLWKRVLRIERVGLDDNFFDLGGDSLLLVAVHSNLQKMLQMEIPVTDLFEFTTIRTLGRHLSEKQPLAPSFSAVQAQAQKQRRAFARERERHRGGAS